MCCKTRTALGTLTELLEGGVSWQLCLQKSSSLSNCYTCVSTDGKNTMGARKRQRIIDLVHAGISIQDMTKIIGYDCKTVYNVKKKWDESGNMARRLGTGLAKPVRSESFLEALEGEITDDPSKSMRALAKVAGCDEKAIRNAIHKDQVQEQWVHCPALLGQEGLDSGPGPQCLQ